MHIRIEFLAGFDARRKPILGRGDRTGREIVERARWVIGTVEVEDRHAVVCRHGRIQEAAGRIRLPAAGLVTEHEEQLVARCISFECEAFITNLEYDIAGRFGAPAETLDDGVHVENPGFCESI